MTCALKKLLVFALSVGLSLSAPALSHAYMGFAAPTASHEAHSVQHYADLSVEPGDDGYLHPTPAGTHHHDDGLCKKSCAACLGASLVPNLSMSVEILSGLSEVTVARADMLIARDIPTEPGIPKPL